MQMRTNLAKGAVYTVSEIRHFTANDADRSGTGVRLFEVESHEDGHILGLLPRHPLRPIVSRPTSIEFAHEILRKVNAPRSGGRCGHDRRYSVWKDEPSQTFEVVMWDNRTPVIVKSGIKSREQAHKAADRLKKQEAGR